MSYGYISSSIKYLGWPGGATVLGNILPWRLTYEDEYKAMAYCEYCTYSRCGWGLFVHFFSRLSFPFSFSLSLGDGPI